MKRISERDWKQNYDQTVISLIHEVFPPKTHFVDIDGDQLVQAAGDDYDEIVRDFSGKTWDQLDHRLISYHHEAPLFMSYEGFLKFLPAYLIDLFDPDTQIVHVIWNSLVELQSFEVVQNYPHRNLNDDQILCCILSFVRSSNFPLDTMIPHQTTEEYFHNPSPEAAFSMLTLGLPHERVLKIQNRIEQINDYFVFERWDQG
ncbi:MAG: hypothetical protein KDA77_07985 [Planctomycetaceae bacterium]|nr:hypothetical protein [Planctomycetaceae bacterium]